MKGAPRSGLWATMAVAAAATIAWVGAEELPWPARVLTVVLAALLPGLLLGQAAITEEEAEGVPVGAVYVSSMVMIAGLGAAAVWAAVGSGWPLARLGLRSLPVSAALLWTGAATLLALAMMVAARALGARESPLLERLLPSTPGQRSAFVLLSLTAGVGEELAFRGFLIPAIATAAGSDLLAVVVSSIVFGMLHSYQNLAGVLRASLLGALLAVPFLATGSLIPSMASHALIDLVAGLLLGDWVTDRNGDA